jgi:hypothetical protein
VNAKEKVLFYLTTLFAAYNLYEIGVVKFSNNANSVNGFFDLLLPLLIIANLVWAVWKRKKMAYISLALCMISILGVIVMLKSVTVSPL